MGFVHRHRWLTPYLLLAPGLAWLGLFFVAPLGFLAHQSLEVQNPIDFSYAFKWAWHNYSDSISTYNGHDGVRNNAKAIYKIDMIAAGFMGRPK